MRTKMNHLSLLLLSLSATTICQSFILAPTHRAPPPPQCSSCLHATQLLEFVEPETNVTVKIVGAMHYNPTSIALARDTVEELALTNSLGSVIIESCDVRWETAKEMNPLLKKLLLSEMRAATDMAMEYQRPVVLGDQRINITVDRMKAAAKETVVDLLQPPFGWGRIASNISQAWVETSPPPASSSSSSSNYLNALSFLDPKLLLAAPVSFLKYPLSYLARSPLPTIGVLALLFLLDPGGVSLDAAAASSSYTWVDYTGSIGVAVLETALFARVILKEILQERNEVLADSILQQCRLYSGTSAKQQKATTGGGWFSSLMRRQPPRQSPAAADDGTPIYVPDSNNIASNTRGGGGDKAVVAVLGMAHSNGIKKLLTERAL